MIPKDSADILTSPFGRFTLRRYPLLTSDKLRAWDAADEYLLNHVSNVSPESGRVLVINDANGALSTALHTWQPVSWGDSVVSVRAAVANRRRNQIEALPVTVPSTENPEGTFDLVLIKIPKATALLNDQLFRLRKLVNDETTIVGAGMVKHIQKSAFTAFETYIGSVSASLAIKKARLVFAKFESDKPVPVPAASTTYTDPDLGFTLENLPNVFSRNKLDHGARFFISHFHKLPQAERVIDLGCGNGVLGIYLQKSRTGVSVTYIDESYSAVASAGRNHMRLFDADVEQPHESLFVADSGLEGQKDESADLILCNPPFHQQHVVGQQIAQSMFSDSKRVLRRGAQLWVVANRHLDYAVQLKKLFGNCTSIATNKKFRVCKVVKR